MEIVERRIIFRTGADRGSAYRDREIERVRPSADVVHLLTLNMHAADEHRFRPFEVFGRGGADIFVDEADRPVRGQIGRDQQQTLRRHEGLDAIGQGISVFECAERRRIARKDAQNAPHRLNTLSSHRVSSAASGKIQVKHAGRRWAINSSTLWQPRPGGGTATSARWNWGAAGL